MRIVPLLRVLLALCLVSLLAACAATGSQPPRPRLVVLFVVDGLPQRQVTAYRDQLIGQVAAFKALGGGYITSGSKS